MNYIEKMLTGEIKVNDFISILKQDTVLQNELTQLIPRDAVNNPEHKLWENISYDSFKNNDFDFLKFLEWMRKMSGSREGTMGDNLNIFSSIKTVYTFSHPDVKCTAEYDDIYGLYLDVAAECFEGPEVDFLLEEIIREAFKKQTKKARIMKARKSICEHFHCEDKKRPRWIQGAEWPMGSNSPMKFLHKKRKGEFVDFYFCDVDNGEIKIIKQYY